VFGVYGDDRRFEEKRRAIAAGDQNVRLAAVAEGFQNVCGGEEVALFVDEEGVAKKTVVIAASGWRLIELIDNREDSGGETIVSWFLRRGGCGDKAEDAGKKR